MPHQVHTQPPAKPLILFKQDLDEPVSVACAGGTAVAYSRRSPTRDSPNQDAGAVLPLWDDCVVLVVADGVGGMRAGHTASATAIRAIRKQVAPARAGDDLRTFILNGIERANENILRQGLGAATTLAVVEIHNGWMRPYHVGDSIILQVSSRGEIKWSALSHAPVSYAVEAGVLSEEAAMLHPERNIISNVVGDRDMRIEIGPPRKLARQDTVVVASDGLCDNLPTREIADLVRRRPFEAKVATMLELARQRMRDAYQPGIGGERVPGKPDDLTAICFRRNPARRRPSEKLPRQGPVRISPEPIDPAAIKDRPEAESLVTSWAPVDRPISQH